MAEELFGTNINKEKGSDEFLEAERLIKETLAETKKLAEQAPKPVETKPAPVIAPIQRPVPPKPAAPAPAQPDKPADGPYEATFREYKVGDIVKGKVIKVDPSGVLVDIKYKADGLIPPDELSDRSYSSIDELVKVGDLISVYILNLENKEGYALLSKKMADSEVGWKLAYDAMKNRKTLQGRVLQVLRGGLSVDCQGVRGFVPASQVDKAPEESLDIFKDKTIPVKVIEVNRRQGKIVMSHRQAAGGKAKEINDQIFNELEPGQVRKGKVSSLKNFGAFVDLGGVEGLVHLTELSWKRVKHPSELLKVGQELDVFVLGVDRTNKKVSLGLKELQPDPWASAAQHYKPGQLTKAKILRFAKFGAFVELEHSLEGLIHVSEISKDQVLHPEDALKIGDVVEVKVLRVIPEEQKIGLSIKQAVAIKERQEAANQAPPPASVSVTEETKKVTLGDMIAQKEKEKAERDAVEETEEAEADEVH